MVGGMNSIGATDFSGRRTGCTDRISEDGWLVRRNDWLVRFCDTRKMQVGRKRIGFFILL